eukprot:c4998_g1_i1.p1 GENE.c4998_g1_i1~~c4998_g1_i1.p1  ORF type:complete len:448 (+),score=90.38 c4998_g1_i1:133-1344(+)
MVHRGLLVLQLSIVLAYFIPTSTTTHSTNNNFFDFFQSQGYPCHSEVSYKKEYVIVQTETINSTTTCDWISDTYTNQKKEDRKRQKARRESSTDPTPTTVCQTTTTGSNEMAGRRKYVIKKFVEWDECSIELTASEVHCAGITHPAKACASPVNTKYNLQVLPHDKPAFIAYPFAGPTLDDILNTLKPTGFSAHDISLIVRGTAQALECLHASNLIHADIKPSNIAIDYQQQSQRGAVVTVIDVGSLLQIGKPHRFEITPLYASILHEELEILPSEPSFDIFSLGITAVELTCGLGSFPLDLDVLPAHKLLRINDLFANTELSNLSTWTNKKCKEVFKKTLSPKLQSMVLTMLNPKRSARPTAKEIAKQLIPRPHMFDGLTKKYFVGVGGTINRLQSDIALEI